MVRVIRWLSGHLFQWGARSAVETALGAAAETVPKVSQRTVTQVFAVKPPITIFVRGSHCRVIVRRAVDHKVTVETNMYRAFGVEWAAEQDEAGVYIVARQKPVLGKLSRTEFTISVPQGCDLAFNLTPGDIVLREVDGLVELPALDALTVPQPNLSGASAGGSLSDSVGVNR